MADISLRVYQSKVDNLLSKNKFNEVIAHCRHILIEHPKNLKAYSQMGQALFEASRWDESAELFRRLLGSLPNDYVAHSHLGIVYQHLEQYADAIWHTERAYDQQPNNSEIINSLRALYKKHRGKDVRRLQLTSGAVAQQHIRNGLYPQAVRVLNNALARYPSRIDLKILRATALWNNERHIDAAETAVEILETLPYAMSANRIMTDLWLMERRPSDAQRYLSRIEDLDPYLAYRLATGETPPEFLVTIEELDYETISRQQLASTNPDWLTALDNVDSQTVEQVTVPDSSADDVEETPAKKVTDDLEDLLSDEWQERVDNLESESIPDDDFGDLFDSVDDDDDLDDLFGDLEDEDPDIDDLDLPEGVSPDDLPDGLLDQIEQLKGVSQHDTMPATNRPEVEDPRPSTGLTGMLSQLEDDEDLDWLTEVQQGEFDVKPTDNLLDTDNLFGEGESTSSDGDGNSDWLEELDEIESSPDAQRVSTGLTGMFDDDDEEDLDDILDKMDADEDLDFFGDLEDEDISEEPINPDDPNAWLQASGIEFSEDAEPDHSLFEMDDDEVTIESHDVNPMAWLEGSEEESDESEADPEELDPMAWLEEEDSDSDAETDSLYGDEPTEDGTGHEVTNFFSDMEESEPESSDEIQFGDEDMLDEMLGLEDAQMDIGSDTDDLYGDATEDGTGHEVTDFFSDLDSESESSDEAIVGDEDMLDEMLGLEDDEMDIGSDTDNLFGNDVEEIEPDGEISDIIDDIEDLEDDEIESNEPSDEVIIGDEDMLDEMLGLENEIINFDVEDNEEPVDSSSPEDRQDAMNDDLNNDWQAEQPEDDNDPMAWLNADDDDEAGDLPEFFDELDDDDDASSTSTDTSSNDEVDLEDMFAQMSDEEFDDDDAGLEWLETDELAEVASDIDLSSDDFDDDDDEDPLAWLNQEGAELDDDIVGESTGMTDMLSALDDEDDEDIEFELDGIGDDDDDAVAELESSDDGGHWLDRIDLESGESEVDVEESIADDFIEGFDEETSATETEADWLAEIEDDGEFEGEDGINEIDWLEGEVADGLDFEADDSGEEADELFSFEEEDEPSSEFDFETTPVATTDDEPDWLSALDSAVEDDGDEAEAVDEPDWLDGTDEFVDGVSAEEEFDDEPDWLAEAEGLEDEAVAEQPDWLNEVSVEDESEEELATENTDEWLSELGELDDTDEEAIAEASDDDTAEDVEQADWLSDVAVAGAGVGAAMAASELLDDADDDEASSEWLAELGEFEEDELSEETAIGATSDLDELEEVEEAELDWMSEEEDEFSQDTAIGATSDLDELDEVEEAELDWMSEEEDEFSQDTAIGATSDLDELDEVEEAELDWMSEEEDEFSQDTAIGASSDLDDLGELDPVSAQADLDWMTDVDDEDEVLFDGELDEQPEGVADFLAEAEEDEPEAVAEGEGSDWLSDIEGFEDEDQEAIAEDDSSDWLSDIEGFEEDEEEAVAEAEPDWLSAVDDLEDDGEEAVAEQDFEFEEDDIIEEPDWLEDMGEGDGVQDAFAEQDELGWEDEVDVEEAQAVEEPDWLDGVGEGDGVQDTFAEASSDSDEVDFEEELLEGFDDEDELEEETTVIFSDEEMAEFNAEELPELEEEFSSAETQESSGLIDEDYLADFEEEIEHTPAEDAPDWLNAMVPGLDIDYEAEEDEPVDQGFISEAQTETSEKGFDWLTDIVEEETGPMAAIPDTPRPQPPTPAPTFTFSKPPAWLDKMLGISAVSSAAVATVVEEETQTIEEDFSFEDFEEASEAVVDDTIVDDFAEEAEAVSDDMDFDSFDDFAEEAEAVVDDEMVDDFTDSFAEDFEEASEAVVDDTIVDDFVEEAEAVKNDIDFDNFADSFDDDMDDDDEAVMNDIDFDNLEDSFDDDMDDDDEAVMNDIDFDNFEDSFDDDMDDDDEAVMNDIDFDNLEDSFDDVEPASSTDNDDDDFPDWLDFDDDD